MNPIVFAAQYLLALPVLFVVMEYLRCDPDERRCLLRRGLIAYPTSHKYEATNDETPPMLPTRRTH